MVKCALALFVVLELLAGSAFCQWQGPANELNRVPTCTTLCFDFELDNLGNSIQQNCGVGAPPQEIGCSNGGCASNGTDCAQGPSDFE